MINETDEDALRLLRLKFDSSTFSCLDPTEPECFSHEITGMVTLADVAGREREQIGKFRVLQVDAEGAMAQGVPVFDVFDCDGELFCYYEELYDDTDHFKNAVLKALSSEDQYTPPGLVIIDSIEIAPEFRGKGYGVDAMRCLTQRFRMGAALVVLLPVPTQFAFERPVPPNLRMFTGTQAAATKKLRRYFRRLGFRAIPGTDLMGIMAGVHGLPTRDLPDLEVISGRRSKPKGTQNPPRLKAVTTPASPPA